MQHSYKLPSKARSHRQLLFHHHDAHYFHQHLMTISSSGMYCHVTSSTPAPSVEDHCCHHHSPAALHHHDNHNFHQHLTNIFCTDGCCHVTSLSPAPLTTFTSTSRMSPVWMDSVLPRLLQHQLLSSPTKSISRWRFRPESFPSLHSGFRQDVPQSQDNSHFWSIYFAIQVTFTYLSQPRLRSLVICMTSCMIVTSFLFPFELAWRMYFCLSLFWLGPFFHTRFIFFYHILSSGCWISVSHVDG